MLNNEERTRYQRQITLDEIGIAGQEKLKRARVLCVGAGGLGTPLCLYLTTCGIGTLGIVDGDIVALDNLHRQILYRHNDCGKQKVETAKMHLQNLNNHTQIYTYSDDLTEENALSIIKNYDVIADCSDNFATRYLVNDAAMELDKPNVFASIHQFQGQCAIFPGKSGPCYRCLFEDINNNNIPNCAEAGVLGTVPGIIGTLQANEVIKLILNIGQPLNAKLLTLDTLHSTLQTLQIPINPDCPICSKQLAFHQLTRPIHTCRTKQVSDTQLINTQQLKDWLNSHQKITLVDVRTPQEYASDHLNAMNIPLQELPQRLNELNQNEKIVLYCRSGVRSQNAYLILRDAGFKNVYHLEGGITAYRKRIPA